MDDTKKIIGETETRESTWRISRLLAAFVVGLALQAFFLPCLCAIGTAKMKMAIILDILIWLRVVAAWMAREQRGGTFYAALWITSPLWIQLAFWMGGVRH
jgi:hypothetical protein